MHTRFLVDPVQALHIIFREVHKLMGMLRHVRLDEQKQKNNGR